jgi:centrosomal CEP192-like protein/NHL repeat-containing protein
VTIIAGNGTSGFGGDGGPAASALLNHPTDMFMDPLGDLYVADADNGLIRKITNLATTPTISTVAGNVALGLGYSGEGGPATSAQLLFPDGVWVDSNQNIFIADKANHIVREVAGVTATNFGISMTLGNIYTIAGTHPTGAGGTTYHDGFSGDGAVATSAMLNNPWAVYGDTGGNIFIADSDNNAIRVVAGATPLSGLVTGNIYTFAGTPPTAGSTGNNVPANTAALKTPHGVYVDASGDVFISDYSNHAIREVANTTAPPAGLTGGNIYTIAGQLGVRGPTGDGGSALAATLDHPSGVFIDGSLNLFIADTDGGAIREVPALGSVGPPVMVAGDIYTVDGNDHAFFGADGGLATNAELGFVGGVASDTTNNIFIADPSNHTIRKAVPGGNIQTVAGRPGQDGYGANGGLATLASLEAPNGVFLDKAGNIFIADTGNHVIREVPNSNITSFGITMTAGNIYTIAGTAPTGPPLVVHSGYGGDNGPAIAALLNTPEALFVDTNGNLFIADTMNHAVREVPAKNTTSFGIAMTAGNIYTVAGKPPNMGFSVDATLSTAAQLNQPWSIFVDGFGDLFIADSNNHVVREVPALTSTSMTAGNIYTLAGTPGQFGFSNDGTPATSAKLNFPVGVAVDPAGDLFISDGGDPAGKNGNNQVIREVPAASSVGLPVMTKGDIYTVAGTQLTAGFTGDGGPATSATLHTPEAIALSPNGNLLIADSQNVRIRSVAALATNTGLSVSPLSLTFTGEPIGLASPKQNGVLINTGSVAVTFTSITPSGDFAQTNTCGTSLAANAQCTISVTFTPTALGARTGTITITDNAAGSPNAINLSGTGVSAPTTLSLVPAAGSSNSQTVKAGKTATYNMQLSATGSAKPVSVTIACTGAPALATCSGPSSAVSVTAGTPAPFTITVTTTGTGILAPGMQSEPKRQPPAAIPTLPLAILSVLMFIAAMLTWMQSPAGRMRTVRMAFAACLILMPISVAALLVGCGGGSSSTTPTPPPAPSTPTGTYTLTVTATATGASQTTQLTLIVQ